MDTNIIIIADQNDDKVSHITDELIACARELQKFTGESIKVVMIGCGTSNAAKSTAEKYGVDIIILNHSSDTDPPPHDFILKNLPGSFFTELHPSHICLLHNTSGLDAAPGLAAKIDAACITGVEKITREGNDICFTRSVFNDRITTQVMPETRTSVLTISPGIYKPDAAYSKTPGQISVTNLPISVDGVQLIGFMENEADTAVLDNADVIVSAGNGVREKEDLDFIYQLAQLFPKSAVTGSRPICDKKWLLYSQQVGVTGATVKPKLYIACGISGASQHISGMRDSKFIVSINTDPHAAIFNLSDVCIIEDLTTFIPELLDVFNQSDS